MPTLAGLLLAIAALFALRAAAMMARRSHVFPRTVRERRYTWQSAAGFDVLFAGLLALEAISRLVRVSGGVNALLAGIGLLLIVAMVVVTRRGRIAPPA